MGKIVKKSLTETYLRLEATASSAGDDNACAVIALAALTGRPFEEVSKLLGEQGREKGKGTFNAQIRGALLELGLTWTELDYAGRRAIIDTYPGGHKNAKSITPHQATRFFKAWDALGLKNGLLFTKGHVMALKDGVVHDHQHQSMKRLVGFWLVDLPKATEEAPKEEAPVTDHYGDPQTDNLVINPAEGVEMTTEVVTEEPVTIEVAPVPFEATQSVPEAGEEEAPEPEAPAIEEEAPASPPCGEEMEAALTTLRAMKRDGLRAECKERGVKNYATMDKEGMIEAIMKAHFKY